MARFREERKTWLAYVLALAFARPLFAGDVARYVDPFVGTIGTGHTTPAAKHSAIYRITGKDKLRLLADCAYGIGGKSYAKTITASNVKLVGKSGLSGRNPCPKVFRLARR